MSASPSILIVEDHQDSSEMISIMLRAEDESYQISVAPTAEKALDLINTKSFDLYILDNWLPKMTGVELCGHIRKTDPNTPIMFFSAVARPADKDIGIAAGANEYLIKPNDFIKLPDTAKQLLSND